MSNLGGKRPGAGRPKTKLSQATNPLKRVTAEEILAEIDEKAKWHALLNATTVVMVKVAGGEDGERAEVTVPDTRIQLDTMKYLTDRRDGKAPQLMQHTGPGGKDPVLNVIVRHIGTGNGSPAKTARAVETME